MRANTHGRDGQVVVVIGCDEIGSAIAHVLHRSGAGVVLIDDIDPPWAWRGRSYVDAWYVGGATLDGIDACFCASVKSIPAILARGDMIAATAWSLEGVANAVAPSAIVETRPRSSLQLTRARPPLLHGTRMIGVRNAQVSAWTADAVIDAAHRADAVGPSNASNPVDAGSRNGRPVRVEAACAGRFRTRHEICERVQAGDIVGELGSFAAIAPAGGMLTALSARGARVAEGQVLLEIDASCDVGRCFGISEDARGLAQHVNLVLRRASNKRSDSRGTMDEVWKSRNPMDLAFRNAGQTAEIDRLDVHVRTHLDA